ncbi:MAG: riboflavin synthase [Magnetococcales bacterium]|nr:riboflavin synthase [Magnetococcales bacterium]
MFTGLIEEVGELIALRRQGQDARLTVRCSFGAAVRPGDSIAVNGVCLTAVACEATGFAVEASSETLSRTTLGTLSPGATLNLERALPAGGRLDGHLVQGHVDTVGTVVRLQSRGRSVEICFRVPSAQGRYIVSKGSIAVDGVSLTVNGLLDRGDDTEFCVNIIPHTQLKTTLATLRVGSEVNIETDLIGRYVERLLHGQTACGTRSRLDEAFLRERGFA